MRCSCLERTPCSSKIPRSRGWLPACLQMFAHTATPTTLTFSTCAASLVPSAACLIRRRTGQQTLPKKHIFFGSTASGVVLPNRKRATRSHHRVELRSTLETSAQIIEVSLKPTKSLDESWWVSRQASLFLNCAASDTCAASCTRGGRHVS